MSGGLAPFRQEGRWEGKLTEPIERLYLQCSMHKTLRNLQSHIFRSCEESWIQPQSVEVYFTLGIPILQGLSPSPIIQSHVPTPFPATSARFSIKTDYTLFLKSSISPQPPTGFKPRTIEESGSLKLVTSRESRGEVKHGKRG